MHITFCSVGNKPQPWLDGLRAALPGAVVTEWQPGAPPADYAAVWAPTQQFFDEQTALRGIFNIGAGVDALMRLRLPQGVPVVRLDDAGMSVQMAEYVCCAVIRHFRELDDYQASAAAGVWAFRKPRQRRDFAVGVMGLGVLGQRVCQAVAQFEFPVNGWSRTAKTLPGVQCYAGAGADTGDGAGGLDAFLANSRVLVCLLPLTPATEGILNKTTLAKLPPGGYLINVARGAHVVDDDLIALIDSGRMAGATLDVFRQEPLPSAHPFWAHPQITVTPHTAARTLREESIAQIAAKIQALHAGVPITQLTGWVDLNQGY